MIRHKRVLLLALVLAAVVSMPLFASVTGGIFGLRTASTDHFDIIYEKGNEATASVVYDSCERLYDSLVQYYGKDPKLHIPVVITSQFKVLNAYYANYPANHIVLFDTVSPVGELSNYPSTIEYVFKHELTHAFQFNLRSKVVQVLSDIFGDVVSISPLLYMYPSMSEGGAVVSESLDGYGRLNDSYAMQIVKQAKIEGMFPQWIDIAGARDTYPSGLLYYNFAAAFLQFLSLTYGYDTVADLYVNFGQPGWFNSVGAIFKDHLGIPVEQAWLRFFEWVDVPSEVLQSSAVSAFDKDGVYSDLVVSESGHVYVYDSASWRVLEFSSDLSTCEEILLAPTNGPELDVSDNGLKLVLVPEVLEGRSSLKLVNVNGSSRGRLVHRFSSLKKDIRGGCFVTIDGTKYVLTYANDGQVTSLDLYDMVKYKVVKEKSLELGYGVTASEFCSIADAKVAFLLSYASHDYVAILDLSDMSVRIVDNPIDAQLTSLSVGKGADSDVLCFTWYPSGTDDASLGRYGELDVHDMVVRLSQTNVNGSMNSALRLGDTIVFVAKFYDAYSLRTIDVAAMDFFMEGVLETSEMFEAPAPDPGLLKSASKIYLPFKYAKDGVLLPFARATYGSSSYDFGLGLSWVTMDPTETYGLEISAGSGWNSVVFASVALNSTSVIPYNVYGTYSYYAQENIHSLETGFDASFGFNLGHVGERLSFSDEFDYCLLFKNAEGLIDRIRHNYFMFEYSNMRATGLGIYDRKGFSVSGHLRGLDPGLSFSILFPRTLWFECKGSVTYNLPLTLTFSANYDFALDSFSFLGFADMVLYSHELQTGIPFFGLYLTREVVDLQYTGTFSTHDMTYNNNLKFSMLLYMSPVVGEYLTNLQFSLGVSLFTDLKDYTGVTLAFGANL
ncbi:MAG: hypothetical protein MJ057_00175 [Sphaerochaetaceae bacterium]|nr:hypothetical protein [Sphaerochaetaceae bacterium]